MTKRLAALLAPPFIADAIAAMFEALTGRKPTPEGMAQVENLLREH